MAIALDAEYRPTDQEPFMNERQRDYFRERLMAWREDILKEAKDATLPTILGFGLSAVLAVVGVLLLSRVHPELQHERAKQ